MWGSQLPTAGHVDYRNLACVTYDINDTHRPVFTGKPSHCAQREIGINLLKYRAASLICHDSYLILMEGVSRTRSLS
jgi:hypothetical protein